MLNKKSFFSVVILLIGFTHDVIHANTKNMYRYYLPTLKSPLAAVLGEGWSTDNEMPVGQCLSGAMDHVGTPSGSVSLDTLYSYDDVMNQLNYKINGDFSFAGFSIGGSADYLHLLKDTSYTQTFIYRASINLKNRHFVPTSDQSPLTWIGQQYALDPQAFRANCGDKFIAEQKIGGALYVAIKFLFHTVEEKSTFNSALHASFASLANLSSNLSKVAESVKSLGNISVVAFQIGGNPLRLGQILGAPSGSEQAPLLSCNLDNLSACQQAINQILTYASQPTDDNFPAQFMQDDPQSPVGPGIIENILQNYSTVVPIKIASSWVTTEITAARKRLSQVYEQTIQQADEVNALINENIPLSDEYATKLAALKNNVDENNSLLNDAGTACYEGDLSRCLPVDTEVEKKLSPIDLSFFAKRIQLLVGNEAYYLFPYSPMQYIYNYGGQFSRDQVFNLDTLTSQTIALSLSPVVINATSANQGASYAGQWRNTATGYIEKITLIPDFKVE